MPLLGTSSHLDSFVVEHVKERMFWNCNVEESKQQCKTMWKLRNSVHFLGRDLSFCRQNSGSGHLRCDVWSRFRQQSCLCPHCIKILCAVISPVFTHAQDLSVSQKAFFLQHIYSFLLLLWNVWSLRSCVQLLFGQNFLRMSACFFFNSHLFFFWTHIHFTHPVLCASFVFLSVCVSVAPSQKEDLIATVLAGKIITAHLLLAKMSWFIFVSLFCWIDIRSLTLNETGCFRHFKSHLLITLIT